MTISDDLDANEDGDGREHRRLVEEHRLVDKARESALAAVCIYNDPAAGFRPETSIVLMVIA